jgi:prepilin-type processing-associated H-X9-DG protein
MDYSSGELYSVRYFHTKQSNFLFADLHVDHSGETEMKNDLTNGKMKLSNVGLSSIGF